MAERSDAANAALSKPSKERTESEWALIFCSTSAREGEKYIVRQLRHELRILDRYPYPDPMIDATRDRLHRALQIFTE